MKYVTLKLPFSVDDEDTARDLVATARLFRDTVQSVLFLAKHQRELPMGLINWINTFEDIAYEVIPNRRYANGAVALVMGIYTACNALGIDFRSVELGDWLMFQHAAFEKQYSNNVALKRDYTLHITTVSSEGGRKHIVAPTPDVVSKYKDLLDAVLDNAVEYMARVVINKHAGPHASGVVELMIPLGFYNNLIAKDQGGEKLVGGISVGAGKVDLVIIKKNYKFDYKKKLIPKGGVVDGIRELLDYARAYGVGALFMEDPAFYDALRWVQPRDGDAEKLRYLITKASIIEEIALEARHYGVRIYYVDPKIAMNNELIREVAQKLRRLTRIRSDDEQVDENTATAYLIARRGLKALSKSGVSITTKW
jgi:hypothetical protein